MRRDKLEAIAAEVGQAILAGPGDECCGIGRVGLDTAPSLPRHRNGKRQPIVIPLPNHPGVVLEIPGAR